jgi:hypothetical protein
LWEEPSEAISQNQRDAVGILTIYGAEDVKNPIKSDFRKGCRAQFVKKDPLIKLNGDGTAILKNVPVFDGFGDNWALDSALSPGWG